MHPHAPASHDFSGSSAKASLSSEESSDEWPTGDAPCLSAPAASTAPAATTAFAGAAAGAAVSPDEAAGATAFADVPIGSTPFAGTATDAAAFSDEASDSTAFADDAADAATFADAATGSTTGAVTFAGATADATPFEGVVADTGATTATGFPQFMQNLASRGSFAPHFVQYMLVALRLDFTSSRARIVSPDTIRKHAQQQHSGARAYTIFFYPLYSPFQGDTPFDYSFTHRNNRPKKRGNHVLQPLWSRKQERGSVLSQIAETHLNANAHIQTAPPRHLSRKSAASKGRQSVAQLSSRVPGSRCAASKKLQ